MGRIVAALSAMAVALLFATAAGANSPTTTQTTTITGSGQTPYAIPQGTVSLQVSVIGATGGSDGLGGDAPAASSGDGAAVGATLSAPFGTSTLYAEVDVGGGGAQFASPGGGASAIQTCSSSAAGCTDTADPSSDPRLVVAGGGGGGGEDTYKSQSGGGPGGNAGASSSLGGPGAGGNGSNSSPGGTGGNAGLQNNSSTATAGSGASNCSGGPSGSVGSPGQGGAGAEDIDFQNGGGGGGGWVGGSGGGSGAYCQEVGAAGGGGAGSSHVESSATGVSVSSTNAAPEVVIVATIAGAPSASLTTPPSGTPTYTYGQTVDASYSCTAGADATISSCTGTVANGAPINTTSTGSNSFTVTATDTDGQSTSVTHDYDVTALAPTVSLTTPPSGTPTYSYGQVVDASYSCTAGTGSTISSCTGTVANGAPVNTTSSGSNSFTVTATDTDGQSTSVTHDYDVTALAPTVSLTTPPTGTPTYTYGQVVDASYSCTAGSGSTLSSCAGPVATGSAINTTSVGSNSFTVTATDADSQSTSVTHYYNVTALPPTVSLSTPPSGTPTYTYGQVVDASYSCTAGSGSTLSSCAGTVATGSAIDTTHPGSNSFTVTATDADSQSTSVTHYYNVTALPPTVSLSTPPSGTPTYTYGQVVDASYSCTAGTGSTLSSCAGPVATGSAINTTSVGSNSFTVTATDADSQSTSVTYDYNVVALPPGVTLTTPPSGTPTYTYGQVVDASYACTAGAGSTLSSCAGTVATGSAINTTHPGSNSFTVTATDADSQSTSVTYNYNVVALPPSVSLATPSGTPTYSYGQVVDASYSCTAGAGSTLSSCSGTVATGSAINTTHVGSNSFTVTATDADSQSTSVTYNYNVVALPPSVALSTPPTGTPTYTYGQVVDAGYACTAGAGSTLSSCGGTVATGSAINTTHPGSNSFTVTATDADSQTVSVTHTYNVVALPPSVTLTTPPSGTPTYTYGQIVDASYSCTAGAGSTLSSCGGTVATGSAINTTHVGSNSFTVTATDADSQATTVTHTYNVVAAATSLMAWPQLVELEPFVGVGSQTVQATLTSGGSPVPGQTVYFTVGATALCHATTNAAGVARCSISVINQALLYLTNHYTASFAATADYTGATATTLVVTFIL